MNDLKVLQLLASCLMFIISKKSTSNTSAHFPRRHVVESDKLSFLNDSLGIHTTYFNSSSRGKLSFSSRLPY